VTHQGRDWPVEPGTCPSCGRASHVGTTCDGRTTVDVLGGFVDVPVRSERDPEIGVANERDPEITEAELRMLWGDR
jgi:hypothetical protein